MTEKIKNFLLSLVTNTKKEWLAVVVLAFAVFSAGLNVNSLYGRRVIGDEHLVKLAERFLQGKLTYAENRPVGDVVDFDGRFYSYFGPLPTMLLMPSVMLMGALATFQGVLGVMAALGCLLITMKLAETFGFSKADSLWWGLFFVFSTVMYGVSIANITAYQVQAVGVFFALASLWAYQKQEHPFMVGMLVAMAGLSRLTYFVMAVYFFWKWVPLKKDGVKKLVWLMIPIVFSLLVLAAYNYRRFGSVLETGYKYNETLETYPMNQNVSFGFLSLKHVPANLYSLLLMEPLPIIREGGGLVLEFPYFRVNPWGLSIFISSPLLLLVLGKIRWKKLDKDLVVGLVALLIPSLMYFGVGYIQFGYRYALDFWPFLLLLMMAALNAKLGWGAKGLIMLGVITNSVYLMSLWGVYPHFLVEINSAGRVVAGGSWWEAIRRM